MLPLELGTKVPISKILPMLNNWRLQSQQLRAFTLSKKRQITSSNTTNYLSIDYNNQIEFKNSKHLLSLLCDNKIKSFWTVESSMLPAKVHWERYICYGFISIKDSSKKISSSHTGNKIHRNHWIEILSKQDRKASGREIQHNNGTKLIKKDKMKLPLDILSNSWELSYLWYMQPYSI